MEKNLRKECVCVCVCVCVFPSGSDDKAFAFSWSGISPGEGNGYFSCLEDPMDRGAWQATVLGVTKSWSQLRRLRTQHNIYLCVCVYN